MTPQTNPATGERETIHELKTVQPFFDLVLCGEKTFEIRFNDRGFKRGDMLNLREFSHNTQQYSGRQVMRRVGYVTDYEQQRGYVVMAIEPMEKADVERELAAALSTITTLQIQHKSEVGEKIKLREEIEGLKAESKQANDCALQFTIRLHEVADERDDLRAKLQTAESAAAAKDEQIAKFGLIEQQLENYKEQWKRHYAGEVEAKCHEVFEVSHELAKVLGLEEYTVFTVRDAILARVKELEGQLQFLTAATAETVEDLALVAFNAHSNEADRQSLDGESTTWVNIGEPIKSCFRESIRAVLSSLRSRLASPTNELAAKGEATIATNAIERDHIDAPGKLVCEPAAKGEEKARGRDGRYDFADLERVCVCGRRLGDHDAEPPRPYDGADGHCDGFQPPSPPAVSREEGYGTHEIETKLSTPYETRKN